MASPTEKNLKLSIFGEIKRINDLYKMNRNKELVVSDILL